MRMIYDAFYFNMWWEIIGYWVGGQAQCIVNQCFLFKKFNPLLKLVRKVIKCILNLYMKGLLLKLIKRVKIKIPRNVW